MATTGLADRALVQKKHGDLKFREYVDGTTSNITSLTSGATLTGADETVHCSGTFTVTLPVAADFPGKRYYIKNTGTGVITIDGDSSETVDNETTQELLQYDCAHIQSDNSEWFIL